MNYRVTIPNINATEAIAIKHTLTDEWKLVDGRDFEWSWFPSTLDESSYFIETPKHAVFKFFEESRATFFQLKYAK